MCHRTRCASSDWYLDPPPVTAVTSTVHCTYHIRSQLSTTSPQELKRCLEDARVDFEASIDLLLSKLPVRVAPTTEAYAVSRSTMSSKSFFVLKTKAIPSRYQLSRNIQTLLEGLDNYHVGSLDIEELGRLVRLSPRRRAAVANTITKCANILKKDPSEVKTCVDIIEMCTEILDIADRQSSTQGFPFMKMPIEIRARTLDLIIDNTFRTPTSQMKALPTLLGSALDEEFYRIFFQSANTFKLLSQLLRLESLTLNISKSTLVHLNERASLMRSYFPLAYRNIRMSDILGLDELLLLRGLQDVHVFNVQPKSNSHGVEMDRVCLWELLTSRLTLPREDSTDGLDQ
ncbi:hypothetical protein ED733_005519 [Metarhizium rileyi]|uniref:Uncharacterized protein n=1 Tax=Metarhizium rileyi (strain RCEF 4871) TaxID=1649241 RepID=A0A5C6GL99_METRR|nr:hypothetical protein ED733_005519 [Metarhizium rileyi]